LSHRRQGPRSVEPDLMKSGPAEGKGVPDKSVSEKDTADEKVPIEEQLKASEKKAGENYDQFLRVTAEFENYRKRMEREMNEFRKYAHESLVKDVLPTIDNLQRALSTSSEESPIGSQGVREGVEMTLNGLLAALEKHGVVSFESLGEPFDPNLHHAVMQEETDAYPENAVARELEKGYMMRGRLLRPAMVVVAKRPEQKEPLKPGAPGMREEKTNKIKVKTI
jgi:molecular chaperone GrpE